MLALQSFSPSASLTFSLFCGTIRTRSIKSARSAERQVQMTEYSEAAKAERRAYKREWNARNREKNKEYQHKYWERRAQERENKGDIIEHEEH